ncbi:MAG: hypothetical protein HYR49_00535 [Gammaproteobacteria bacterium]|nr:hypothetical protein [Gammaproteobacteria bacterium]
MNPGFAGSQPKGRVHSPALRLLQQYNFQTGGFRSRGVKVHAGLRPIDARPR